MPAKSGAMRGLPCGAAGCPGRTNGGKSYCSAHLHRMPYVLRFLSHLPGVKERIANDPGMQLTSKRGRGRETTHLPRPQSPPRNGGYASDSTAS